LEDLKEISKEKNNKLLLIKSYIRKKFEKIREKNSLHRREKKL